MTLSCFAVGMVFSKGSAQQVLASVVIMMICMIAADEVLNAITAYMSFRSYEAARRLLRTLEESIELLMEKRQMLLEEIEEHEAMDRHSGKDNVVH